MTRYYTLLLLIVVTSCHNRKEPQTNFFEIPDNSIINLYDAFGESHQELQKDFGFSAIVKYSGKTILFDAGTNADIFKQNVEALNINLKEVDFVVASHSHFDHINGFDYLLEINPDVKIYFPFDPFWGSSFPFNLQGQEASITDSLEKRMQYFDGNHESFAFNPSGRFWNANIEFINANQEIAPGIKLVATKSPYMGYFSKYPNLDNSSVPGTNSGAEDIGLTELQELSLSLNTGKGEVVIVGCSHSTVERIISETKTFTKNKIGLVYGGYHLLPYDRTQLTALAGRLKNDLAVAKVAPAHCTGHLAFKILQDSYKENYVFAGLGTITEF